MKSNASEGGRRIGKRPEVAGFYLRKIEETG